MNTKKSKLKFFMLSLIFIAVAVAVFAKNVPRIVDLMGLLICGFASGSLFTRGLLTSKLEKK